MREEEEEEGRKGRERAREKLSPSLFIPCLTEQSVGRQVWAADESTRSGPRRLAKWNQAGPRTQPDDAISTGVAGKRSGKKKKSPKFTDGACSKCAIQRRYQKAW